MASKAQYAAALLHAFQGTKTHGLKVHYVTMLDDLWPGVRCSYESTVGLKLFFRSGHITYSQLPQSLLSFAGYVEEIRLDGTAKIWRNDKGPTGVIPQATRALTEFPGTLPRAHRTVWEMIYSEDPDD